MTTGSAKAKPPKAARAEPVSDEESTASAIRKRNLLWLREKHQKKVQTDFPDAPDHGMDRHFAEHIGLNPKYFGHIKNGRRNVGNALAREVERVFGLPIGWLDSEHAEAAGASRDENEVVAAALRLFRLNPDAARRALMNALNAQLDLMPSKARK